MRILRMMGPPPYQTNCYILLGNEGHALVIDPAVSAQRIDEQLKKVNAQLSMILLTHGHFDHVSSVQALAEEWSCPVYLDPADARGDAVYPLALESRPYTEGGKLLLDDIELTSWHTPGHTPGSWLLYGCGLLFSGDTLFAGGVGRTDLEGGDAAQQRQSFEKLKNLPMDSDTQVLPGHGPFSTVGEELETNPYLMF